MRVVAVDYDVVSTMYLWYWVAWRDIKQASLLCNAMATRFVRSIRPYRSDYERGRGGGDTDDDDDGDGDGDGKLTHGR